MEYIAYTEAASTGTTFRNECKINYEVERKKLLLQHKKRLT